MKGRRTDLSASPCAASRSLEIIGDWWSLLIVRDALTGVHKFGEFQKSIGLAKNILASRLKKLVEADILQTEPDGVSTRHKYVLTKRGKNLAIIVTALWQWGEENCFVAGEDVPQLFDEATSQPLAKLQLQTLDGRIIAPGDLRMGVRT